MNIQNQQMTRPNLLIWIYKFFPYLQADILSSQEFPDEDLQMFCTLTMFDAQQGEEITTKLRKRSDEIQRREEEAMRIRAGKKNFKTEHQYFTDVYSYSQPNFQYDANYTAFNVGAFAAYPGFEQFGGYQPQGYQQQTYDYSGSYPQQYNNQVYQQRNNNFQSNNYLQGNQRYSQSKPNFQSYQQGYEQSAGYNQQQTGYQSQQNSGQQSYQQNTQQISNHQPEIAKTVSDVKTAQTQASPIVQKQTEKQTAPSTPSQVSTQKQQKPVVEPAAQPVKRPQLSFAELKKAVIDFKDYSKISQAFKAKIQEINKRQPIYQQLKISQKAKKYSKTPYNQNQQQKPADKIQRATTNPEPFKPQPSLVCQIIRREQNEEQKELKNKLRESSKGGGIGIALRDKVVTEFQKAQKQIKFNLNLITLQNFQNIKKDLIQYVINDERQCQKLINLMIQKAWIEPKYAIIYAKLSSDFGKLDNFKWGDKKEKTEDAKKKGSNPFKTVLIKVVQQVFEDDFSLKKEKEKLETIQQQKDQDSEQQITDTKIIKKKVVGNVRFIGQLLLQKVLSKKIVYYCVGHLLQSFFKHYSHASDQHESDLAEIYFQSLIELIQKVGEKFQNKQDKISDQHFKSLFQKIQDCSSKPGLLVGVVSEEWILTTERFFQLFEVVDKEILMGKYPRISALLKNLTERKQNNWQSHIVENKGPMTLLDARKQEEGNDEYERKKPQKESFDYEKQWSKIFAKYDKGQYLKQDTIDEYVQYTDDNAKEDLKKLFKQDAYEIISAYVRIFADGPRPIVQRRVKLFQILLDMGFIKYDHLKQGWLKNAGKLCYSDFPLAAAYFPKVMAMMNAKYPIHLPDWEIKNTDDEEETQYAADVLQKYKKEIQK